MKLDLTLWEIYSKWMCVYVCIYVYIYIYKCDNYVYSWRQSKFKF